MWKNERAVKAGLRFRPAAETVADTLRWYKGQKEGDRTKLAGPTPEREAELLAKWKEKPGN
jgi:2'-hydroxyisoflavone reductase